MWRRPRVAVEDAHDAHDAQRDEQQRHGRQRQQRIAAATVHPISAAPADAITISAPVAAFAIPEAYTSAFVVTHKGRILAERFPAVKAAYVQQALDYGRHSRYGDRWKISCYLVVLEKWKPKIMPHAPMVDAMGDVMELCRIRFEAWYAERFGLARCDAKGIRA